MTVAILMDNTFKSAERFWDLARARKVKPLNLKIVEPVGRYVSRDFIYGVHVC